MTGWHIYDDKGTMPVKMHFGTDLKNVCNIPE